MVRVALALVALCGACFTKPGFSGGDDDHNGDGGVDARRDAPPGGYMDAPDAPNCTTIIDDPFTTMTGADPCLPWGIRMTGNAVITRSGGTLNMTGPMPSTGFSGGCQGTTPFSPASTSVTIRLVNSPLTPYWSTSLELTTAAAETTAIRVSYNFNAMMMGTYIAMTTHVGTQLGMMAYAPTTVQYLRLTATSATTWQGEYSPDGTSWTVFGDDVYAAPISNVTLALRIGAMGGTESTVWDDLKVLRCP